MGVKFAHALGAHVGRAEPPYAKAIFWILTNCAKPLRVEDLAEIEGMGVSTLHYHFRVLTTVGNRSTAI